MDNSLHSLLDKVKRGDETAFAEIERIYAPLISSLTDRLNASVEMDCEDIRQEAMIALYSAACTYDQSKSGVTFGLYAKICIRNRLISLLRKQTPKTDELEETLAAHENENPEISAVNEDSFKQLTEKIDDSLTEFERSVFKLYITGTAYGDIASSLGKPRKSVDNAIYRIKAKIKKLI